MEKDNVAGKTPQMVEVKAGQSYAWCSCAKSGNQPFCDGAHKGGEFSPKVFQAEESKTAAICMCKQTKNPPYCDGSHMKLGE